MLFRSAVQSLGEVAADRPQPVIPFNEDTIREILKGTPRASLALQRASPAQSVGGMEATPGGMGATPGVTDANRRISACVAEAKRKGSDARHCFSHGRMP